MTKAPYRLKLIAGGLAEPSEYGPAYFVTTRDGKHLGALLTCPDGQVQWRCEKTALTHRAPTLTRAAELVYGLMTGSVRLYCKGYGGFASVPKKNRKGICSWV